MGELKKTPLYEEHVKLGAKIVEFGGWEMPVFYSNVIDEHITTRTKAGLFDICHMGEIFVEGKDAFNLIQKLITNDLSKLSDGKCFYSVICLENGGVIDDLFVYRFNDEQFMIVVNAGNIEKDFKWFLKHKDFFDNVFVFNRSDETAKLDLQGSESEKILQKLTLFELKDLKRFSFVESEVNGISALISRTGYTAEDGFEIYFNAEKAAEIWNKILEVGAEFGIKPIGLGARDTLRVEACYSLYGHELTEQINPLEAGVGFVVKLEKEDFIGKAALLEIKEKGLKRRIAAFEMVERGIAREHYPIFKGDSLIGDVSSGTMSPTFKKGLGMAFVDTDEALVGNEINIKIRKNLYKAKIVKKPIYNFHGKTN
ncbi:MAG: glycine cleavage system aminomethyltransferase GcvT [Nanoarchaeota archaeon]|nr:glycine cleavage system aminomethyltransferase GcvT [Nanoarchaeota archaeon]MBU1945778.1 glycine cleavage system aminomethyltransferase GcvT [Nanoarchaeota archaeon]